MNFQKCCNKSTSHEFNWQHNPIPIKLTEELRYCLDFFLWYSPLARTDQKINSFETVALKSIPMSDIIFNRLLSYMDIDPNHDVLVINQDDPKEKFPIDVIKLSKNDKVCVKCQKIAIKWSEKNESKSIALLRHIGNSIAHGRFNVIGDMIIARDYYKKKLSGYIKLNIFKFYNAIEKLYSSELSKTIIPELLCAIGFRKTSGHRFVKLHIGLYGGEMEHAGEKYRMYLANELKHFTPFTNQLPDFIDEEDLLLDKTGKELFLNSGYRAILDDFRCYILRNTTNDNNCISNIPSEFKRIPNYVKINYPSHIVNDISSNGFMSNAFEYDSKDLNENNIIIGKDENINIILVAQLDENIFKRLVIELNSKNVNFILLDNKNMKKLVQKNSNFLYRD